jgi:hypothetical protein
MKLDNKELFVQRTRILENIAELVGQVEALKEHVDEYVQPLDNVPGIVFKVKGILYALTNKNRDIEGTVSMADDVPSVLFKALDDKPIDYYKTAEGKVDALNMFGDYIINNMHVVLRELVRVDDLQNGITEINDESIDTDPHAYYNHPSEIRARTQECLYLAIAEMLEAIDQKKIKNKADLKEYKDTFTKAEKKNNFAYWTDATFNNYLDNLDYVLNLMGLNLPG